jgi:hypothetical protein
MAAINRYPHVPERNARVCARYDESRAEKLSFDVLGREFGLNRETVRLIVRRRDHARNRRRDHARKRLERQAVRLRPLREALARGVGRPKG